MQQRLPGATAIVLSGDTFDPRLHALSNAGVKVLRKPATRETLAQRSRMDFCVEALCRPRHDLRERAEKRWLSSSNLSMTTGPQGHDHELQLQPGQDQQNDDTTQIGGNRTEVVTNNESVTIGLAKANHWHDGYGQRGRGTYRNSRRGRDDHRRGCPLNHDWRRADRADRRLTVDQCSGNQTI